MGELQHFCRKPLHSGREHVRVEKMIHVTGARVGKNPLLFVITCDNKQECFMPCGGVESVADATRRRRGNPASRILFQVCYRDEDVAGDNTDN